MPKFKPGEFKVIDESSKLKGVRVMKGVTPQNSEGTPFSPEKLNPGRGSDYQALKKKFGSLALTDPEAATRGQKSRRFNLSPLVKGPLQIEAEEMRALEDRVQAKIAELGAQAEADGRVTGFEQGMKEGKKEAFEAFRKEAGERVTRFQSLLQELESVKDELFRANEKFLLEVIFRVARMVVLKELSTDKEYLVRLTRELIDRVGVRENIKIRIHPEDMTTVGMLQEGLEKAMGALKNLNIQTATHVRPGGCEIETEWNAIEASVETQLAGVRAALLGEEGRSKP